MSLISSFVSSFFVYCIRKRLEFHQSVMDSVQYRYCIIKVIFKKPAFIFFCFFFHPSHLPYSDKPCFCSLGGFFVFSSCEYPAILTMKNIYNSCRVLWLMSLHPHHSLLKSVIPLFFVRFVGLFLKCSVPSCCKALLGFSCVQHLN